jgi:signal transduction histidine kinase
MLLTACRYGALGVSMQSSSIATCSMPTLRLQGDMPGLLCGRHFVSDRTFAADQKESDLKPSTNSQKMRALRHEVFVEWELRVRGGSEEVNRLKQPILINTLPAFFDHMAESIAPEFMRINARPAAAMAIEHGSQRARLTNYDPKKIILDFQLLRTALLDVMKRNGVALNQDEFQVIESSIEDAIRESITGYVVAVSVMREQVMDALVRDVRSRLALVSANAQLIVHKTESPETKERAGTMLKNTGRMDEIIQALLVVMAVQGGSRLALNLFNFDLLELVKFVVAEAEIAHGPRFHITGDSVEVIWSHEDVHQALENLIGNAVKYVAPNTRISIKLDRVGERLLMSVHNEGNPIPPDECESIFEIFQRVRASRQSNKEGWGIGLPFIRAVAKSHGGSCWVDSSLERGTTLFVDLPVDARPFQRV